MGTRKPLLPALLATAAVAAAGALSGCGASSAIDPVARAADVTAKVPGYRMQATMTTQTSGGTLHMTMSGTMDQTHRVGQITGRQSIAGHQLTVDEEYSGLTFYLRTSDIPNASRLTGGKPWMEMDMSRALGAMGLGSLSTTNSNPAQFIDYLRADGAKTQRLGTQTIRGVGTTHYHALIDLARYPQLLPQAQRASAARGVSTLEAALGSRTLPMDVWLDSSDRVRRMSLSFAECVQNQHLHMSMTMDMFDYGPQAEPQLPAASQVYNATPLISAEMKNVKLGCSSS